MGTVVRPIIQGFGRRSQDRELKVTLSHIASLGNMRCCPASKEATIRELAEV